MRKPVFVHRSWNALAEKISKLSIKSIDGCKSSMNRSLHYDLSHKFIRVHSSLNNVRLEVVNDINEIKENERYQRRIQKTHKI